MKRTLLRFAAIAAVIVGYSLDLPAAEAISASALSQIQALQAEKAARPPAQQKMDSQLVYAVKQARKEIIAPGLDNVRLGVAPDANGLVLVDITAEVSQTLLGHIAQSGGQVVHSSPRFRAIRARLPLNQIESLAARADVKTVRPADQAEAHVGRINSEGDTTHNALPARLALGINGAGVKVGVISDSVDFLAASQASGDLPFVNVLPGQDGIPGSGEGTAMLEIVHDLAPGANLYFASAFNGQASFAQNILDLRAAGCDVIVDDVRYFAESPFQDGIIAQAVNEVTAGGALFFSSAGNSVNKNDGTSGTWEGDFLDGGAAGGPVNGKGGRVHSFGANNYNTLTASSGRVFLHWSDPSGASTNDYDLYVLDPTGANIVAMSTTVQNGTQDPIEGLGSGAVVTGSRIVIVKADAAAPRYMNIDSVRGRLSVSTAGEVKGHAVATNAFCVAAVDVATAFPNPFVGGAANPVESFSSDGPRRVFYHANGAAITPGSFTSTGGVVRLKPDIAAADGGQTTVPGFSRFFGTSAAAPHAAAIAALLKSFNPFLTPQEMRTILTNSALDIEAPGLDSDSGVGIVMAAAALSITPPGRGISFVSAQVVGGNQNELIDPNECNELFLTLKNIGRTNAVAGLATLTTTTPGVTILEAVAAFPFTPTNGLATNVGPFRVQTSPGFVCGVPIDFQLVVASGTRNDTNQIRLRTGQVLLVPALRNNNTPLAIPDNSTNGVISTINVAGVEGAIGKLTVALHINHSAPSNLVVDLIGPDGTAINLAFQRGVAGLGYGTSCVPLSARTTFDDNAQFPISVAVPPFVGAFRPEQALTAFYSKNGAALNGQWRLRVSDTEAGAVGVLECWTLAIYPSVCEDGGGNCTTDLGLSVTASPEPAVQGINLTYNVAVTNQSLVSASAVVLTNVLPVGVTYDSATASQGGCSLVGGVVRCDLGVIGGGSGATVAIVVRPTTPGSLTNTFTVSTSSADGNPGNNVATVVSTVTPPLPILVSGGTEVLLESFSPSSGGIEAGETVTLNLALRNIGYAASTNLVATLLDGNGVSGSSGSQNYGAIAIGARVARPFTFTALGNAGETVSAVLQLQDGVLNLGTVTFHFTLGGDLTFANGAEIIINNLGAASPYPATIDVNGVAGVIGQARVTFTKLSHTFPDDIDALLVGPLGQKLVLMSDAGGGTPIVNRTLTFTPTASGTLPNESAIAAGNYLPSDFTSGTEPAGDLFPAPAPAGPLVASLASFNGTSPNGTWSLFLHDDGGNDGGSVSGGWSLGLTIVVPVLPLANLSVTASAAPVPAIVGEPLTYTVTVANSGPSNATAVVLTDLVPPGTGFVSANSSQGTASESAGVVTANLGTINSGATATVAITVTPNSPGAKINVASVTGDVTDLDLGNNSVTTSVTANNPVADLVISASAAPSTVFVSSNVTFHITITNRGPNHADAVQVTNRLAASMNFVSATNSQGACSFSGGVITCDFGSLAANASATATIVATPFNAGAVANLFAVIATSTDSASANNTTNVITTVNALAPLIVSSGVALTSESVAPANGAIESGELVTINFGLRNVGTLDAGNLVATLLATGGVTGPSAAQNYGALVANGPTASRSFSFTASAAAGGTLTATLQLQDGAQNLGTVQVSFNVSASRGFTNSDVIIIPLAGAATNYPATITVSGVTGTVSKVTVSLRQFTHTFPEDVDVLLVGPAGQKVMLMSDAGAGNSVSGVTLTFDGTGGALPFASAISGGTYRPTDYPPGDILPAPAPAGPYGTNLSAFNSVNPNGTWSLYVFDDANGDAGRMDGGWTLNIQTATPIVSSADVAVTATGPASIIAGSPVSYVVTVANYGPATATGVTLTDTLPAGFTLGSVSVSQGSYITGAGLVTANLGALASGTTATVTISGTGTANLTNLLAVTAAQSDANLANNSFSIVTVLIAPTLSIRSSGANVVIAWPAPSAGYVLESSSSVLGPWAAAGLTITVVGGENQVTAPATGTVFYRLRKL